MSESTPLEPGDSAQTAAQPVRARALALPALLGLQLLLLALLALGGWFGWQLWQQRGQLSVQGVQQQAQMDSLQQQLSAAAAQVQSLQKQLAEVPDNASALAQLQRLLQQFGQAQGAMERHLLDNQQQLAEQLDELRGSRYLRDWQLNEAFYQMRLASLRLEVMQDSKSAQILLKNADSLLSQQDDPAGFAVRKALAEALHALERQSSFDRSALYLQLAALRNEAARLTQPLPAFSAAERAGEEQTHWWQRWGNALSRYVRVDFDANAKDIRPLLGAQSLNQARLALMLALEQAQWALLHGEQAVYTEALTQANDVLALVFNARDAGTQSLHKAIDSLKQADIAQPLADLAPLLAAMQQYLHTHAQAAERAARAAADADDEGEDEDSEDSGGDEATQQAEQNRDAEEDSQEVAP